MELFARVLTAGLTTICGNNSEYDNT